MAKKKPQTPAEEEEVAQPLLSADDLPDLIKADDLPDLNAASPTPQITPQGQPVEEPGILKKMWDWSGQPLTDAPSRFAKSIADDLDNPLGEGGGGFRAFLAGSMQAAGDMMTDLTTPRELAAAALTGGESMALKRGATGIGRALNVASNVPLLASSIESLDEGNYGSAILNAGLGVRGLMGHKAAAAALPKKALNTSEAVMGAGANLPGTIKIKRPSTELLNKLRGNGYRFSHVGDDGYPVWKLTDEPSELIKPGKESKLRQLWNLPRGASTTADLSAPLRQGFGLIHKREFWGALPSMMKSWASKEGYDDVMGEIASHPLFTETAMEKFDNAGKHLGTKRVPSFGREAGLALESTMNAREEQLASKLLESIPGYGRVVKASSRAYTAFLNKLRADTFINLVESNGAKDNLPLAKEIANFINTATGRGSLGRFEKNAQVLTDALFSPRLVASRVRMMDPRTYMMASPEVRKEYFKSMAMMAGTWSTIAGLSSMLGAKVSIDPTNADFGKIRIGNTRLDPAAGFQQYLVAMARFASGKTTSSTSGKTREFGAEYGSPTRLDLLKDFAGNKAHPLAKFGLDIFNASKYRPVNVGDRMAQLFVPLFAQDVMELMQEDPTLIPLAIPSALGMSSQTYERTDPDEDTSMFVPRDMDFSFKGGGF